MSLLEDLATEPKKTSRKAPCMVCEWINSRTPKEREALMEATHPDSGWQTSRLLAVLGRNGFTNSRFVVAEHRVKCFKKETSND